LAGKKLRFGGKKIEIELKNINGKVGIDGGDARKLAENLDGNEFNKFKDSLPSGKSKTQIDNYHTELGWCRNGLATLGAEIVSTHSANSCPPTGGFSPGEWKRHFDKHGSEFNFHDPEDYLRRILDLHNRKGSNVVKKIDPNTGVIRVYDKTKNELAAFNPNGTPRTLFKLDPSKHGYSTNLDYWLSQPGTEVLN
jgi:hypothetical protein